MKDYMKNMASQYYYDRIVDYYDKAENAYRDAWDLDTSMAMHYGIWTPDIKNLRAALRYQNQLMAQLAEIKSTDLVLDAGCGVGGSIIFLATAIGCHAHGITLSDKQVKKAIQNSQQGGVMDKTTFIQADYLHTPFESNTYDVVWATESVCYAENIQDFTDEAFRILKPGGRLIVADGFATPKKINKKEKSYLDKWIPYWAMKELQTEKEFSRAAHTSGFKNYIHRNYTSNIKKSVRRIYYYSIAAIFITRVYRLFGKTYGNETAYKNTIGGINQFKAYQKGLWEYYIITAVKEIEK